MEASYSALDYLNGVALPLSLSLPLTTVEFEDVGPVRGADWSSSSQDTGDVEARTELGLPTEFASSKRRYRVAKRSRKRPKHEAAAKLRRKLGRNLFKYWLQRYSLFSRFDEGIQIDKQGWYSVTPECIAAHHASKHPEPLLVLDACCGVGGNTIQFAQQGHYVIAVDSSPTRLQMAHHNASVYKVAHRVDFLIGDVFELGTQLQPDLLFVSPPWGGPHYVNEDYVTLDSELGTFVRNTVELAQKLSEKCVTMMFLPRNLDLSAFMELPLYDFVISEIEIGSVNSVVKGITLYLKRS